ncbi:3-oxoacyl-[acyl-carrier-protein] reductase [candidate division KSB1 bacterium]
MGILEKKVAVVTGAGRGIGSAIAKGLSAEGAFIVVSDIDENTALKTVDEIFASGGKAVSAVGDVSVFDDAKSIVDKASEEFSGLDILVNNAGIVRDNLIMRMSIEDWDSVISVNLKGVFNLIKAASRVMLKRRYGKIINISSVVGIMGNAGQANYSASKAGIIGLTRTAAKEFASRNICVNAVAPGYIETDMTKKLSDEAKDAFLNAIPLRRSGSAEDVVNIVKFLASSDSDYITGQVIQVDGGMIMA